MSIVSQREIGSLVAIRSASHAASQTAAGTGDNTVVTGIVIDRNSFTGAAMPLSARFEALFDATLASGATLSVSLDVRHSSDNSTFVDYASVASAVVATGPSGGGAVSGQVGFNVNLSSANRYVRFDHVPDLSAAGTDTSTTRAVGVLGGFDELPAIA